MGNCLITKYGNDFLSYKTPISLSVKTKPSNVTIKQNTLYWMEAKNNVWGALYGVISTRKSSTNFESITLTFNETSSLTNIKSTTIDQYEVSYTSIYIDAPKISINASGNISLEITTWNDADITYTIYKQFIWDAKNIK